nr:unnamed protein product [Callosobruchus analis]
MWSKQVDPATSGGKNMTFKNKIGHRKRSKNDRTVEQTVDSNGGAAEAAEQPKQGVSSSKSGKNRGRNRSSKKEPALTGAQSCRKTNGDVKSAVDVIDKDVECGDVVLRHPDPTKRGSNSSLKRYSDSFIIDDSVQQSKTPRLLELNPGTTLLGEKRRKCGDSTDLNASRERFFCAGPHKKGRRFSDLFRPGSMKLSASTENLKVTEKNKINLERNTLKPCNVNIPKTKVDTKAKQNKKTETLPKVQSPKVTSKRESVTTAEPSYLKRVRSRIYKTKSDDTASLKIDEDAHQTDVQLEKKSIAAQKSADVVDAAVHEKPALAKSKSSSAINLNLLRARRNKILEQVASRFGVKTWGTSEVKGGGVGGQPVSRSGSDRRPDAVREEACSKQEAASPESASSSASGDPASAGGAKDRLKGEEHSATPNSSTILPATGSNRKVNSININRSESVKEQSEKRKQQRRNHSDPSHTVTR